MQPSTSQMGGVPFESPNTVTIRSGVGVTVFTMKDAGELWFRQDWNPGSDKVVINLEGDERVSGGSEYSYGPSIIISWLDSPFDLDGLLNRSIQIPLSYSEEQKDHVTNFYYGVHLDFDDVRVSFVERNGERFRILVTGKTMDIESTDPGDITVEIDTFVDFVDRNSPPVIEPPRTVEGIGEFADKEWCWESTAEYAGRPIQIRLSSDGERFGEFAKYARTVIRQEAVSLGTIRNDIKSRLSSLKWKFDEFNVNPNFNIEGFIPETFTVTEAGKSKKSDDVQLYVFLTHPESGTDNWILRYSNSECYDLEWIPNR